jgi:hypothetical protein
MFINNARNDEYKAENSYRFCINGPAIVLISPIVLLYSYLPTNVCVPAYKV